MDNLVHLPVVTEKDILNVLSTRYACQKIYTNSGKLLLAVNPYMHIPPLFSNDTLKSYCSEEFLKYPPHPWRVAASAYNNLLAAESLCDQSVLISGESGAGKSETTKIIMTFLAHKGNLNSAVDTAKVLGNVQHKVLQTNPILEALGNAKTLRNDNSSRFGKFIKLFYSSQGELLGCSLNTFLLEATRVAHQQPQERNFHIFYMVCAESKAAVRDMYKIRNPQDFSYLTVSGGCFERSDGISDVDLLTSFTEALEIVSPERNSYDAILRSIMAVLYIGNAQFSTLTNAAGEVVPSHSEECRECVLLVSELIGVSGQELLRTLTTRNVTVNHEDFEVMLSGEQSNQLRDVFSKALYRALFEWSVQMLNERLAVSSSPSSTTATTNQGMIGLLDIFGFETFEMNSLEQLLINYCNESLQLQFDSMMIQLEQGLYLSEEIEWNFIEFPSAQESINLISGAGPRKCSPSILSLLDEACIAPSGSDASFIRQVYTNLDSHSRISVSHMNRAKSQFGIKHFAGTVVYDSRDFVSKNKTLYFPLDTLLQQSSHPHFKEMALVSTRVVTAKTPASSSTPKRRLSMMQVSTISSTFCSDVNQLLDTISATNSQYIKCLKPNTMQVKENFDSKYMLEQLVYGGVVHSLNVVRCGFPVRYTYKDFWCRYHPLIRAIIDEALSDESDPDHRLRFVVSQDGDSAVAGTDVVIVTLEQAIDIVIQRIHLAALKDEILYADGEERKLDASLCIQRGKSIVFLRQSGFLTLESFFNKLLGSRASVIQSFRRMKIQQRRYQKILRSLRSLQSRFRLRQGLKKWRSLVRSLRLFIRRCAESARRVIKFQRTIVSIQRCYRRRAIIKKWRPILNLLRRFLLPLLRRIRLRIAKVFLASSLWRIYSQWKTYCVWKRTIKALRHLARIFRDYSRRLKATKYEKVARIITRAIRAFRIRKTIRIRLQMVRRLQRWVRFGEFRSYVNRKEYIRALFEASTITLQRMWRWKRQIYQSIQKLKDRQKWKDLDILGSRQITSTFSKESLVSLYNQVDSSQGAVDGKKLLSMNRNILWVIFSYYLDNKAQVPASVEKRVRVALLPPRSLLVLLRDWAIIPKILTPSAAQNLTSEILEDQSSDSTVKGDRRAYLSYNYFCSFLVRIAANIVKAPDPAILKAHETRTPILDIRARDALALDPIMSPAVGAGLRWILSAMDRSNGRAKFSQSRSSVIVPAFFGVLGVHDTPKKSQKPRHSISSSPAGKIALRIGPISSEVMLLIRRNEATLVSLALRYSGGEHRASYYQRLNPSAGGAEQQSETEIMKYESNPLISPDLILARQGSMSSERDGQRLSLTRLDAAKRDQMRKGAVQLTESGLWRLCNDFGICPEHSSKSTLKDIYEFVLAESPFPRETNLEVVASYDEFVEILNMIAQNSSSDRCKVGTTEDRMRNIFHSMNMSSGRERLASSRNTLVLPCFYLDSWDANEPMPGSSFGSFSFPTVNRRSSTPPPTSISRSRPTTPTSSRRRSDIGVETATPASSNQIRSSTPNQSRSRRCVTPPPQRVGITTSLNFPLTQVELPETNLVLPTKHVRSRNDSPSKGPTPDNRASVQETSTPTASQPRRVSRIPIRSAEKKS